MATPDTNDMERHAMNGLFWNQGGTYIHAETPERLPALGRVNLEHDAPVPRHTGQGTMSNAQCPRSIEPSALSIEHCSEDQHRVTVAVEPIPPLHGLTIDGEDLVAARKRRREDQQRRLR
jgi:hypothetical protein